MQYFKASILITLLSVFVSCTPDRYGCTGPSAENYDSKANTNDRSCIYKSQGIVYWDNNTQFTMTNSGVTAVSVYLDEEQLTNKVLLTEYDPFSFSNTCIGSNWPRFDTYVYEEYSDDRVVRVFDQNDSLIIVDVIYIGTGPCNIQEISY